MKVKDGAVIAASCLETETLKTAQEGGGVLPTGAQVCSPSYCRGLCASQKLTGSNWYRVAQLLKAEQVNSEFSVPSTRPGALEPRGRPEADVPTFVTQMSPTFVSEIFGGTAAMAICLDAVSG